MAAELEIESCPECDGAKTARGSCVCDGNGVIPKRPEQLRLFEKDKDDDQIKSQAQAQAQA